MSKRTLMMVVALVAALALAATGTLAYLTDTDSDVNVMTLGNVDIEQHEMKRADGVAYNQQKDETELGDLVPFVEGIKLYPAYPATSDAYTAGIADAEQFYWGPYVHTGTASNGLWNESKLVGAVDKFVFVENTGDSPAFFRTLIAFECPDGVDIGEASQGAHIMINESGSKKYGEPKNREIGYITINDARFLLYEYIYQDALLPGQWSHPSLLQVVMTHNATNETIKLLGETYEIYAFTQAVQEENLKQLGAEKALDAAFGDITVDNHPWVEGVVSAGSDEQLLNAIQNPENSVVTVKGDLTYDWGGESYDSSKALLMKDKTFVGDGPETSLTFKGYGSANEIYDVDLMNLTVRDETVGDDENAWEHGYLEFVNLKANNVTFEDGIMLSGDCTLVGCTFNNVEPSWYAAWIEGGNVQLVNCTFNGTRGVKIHEAYSTDVESVLVDNCDFTLSEKPGVVIGNVNAATAVTISNSAFDTQPGDQSQYYYESDTPVSNFEFTQTNNTKK